MAIDTTRALIAQITNASQVGENTATRVGTTMDAMLDDIKDASDLATSAETKADNVVSRIAAEESVNAAQDTHIAGLQAALANVQQVTINGNVTNNPDQVFLTAESNLITPKERTTANSAKGHYIMRSGEFAAKLQANYIHELPFDIDLNGTSVTIPSGAVLRFTGGKISNGDIVFADTLLEGDVQFATTANLSGTIANNVAKQNWIENNDIDSWHNLINNVDCANYEYTQGTYYPTVYIDKSITKSICVNGNGASLHFDNGGLFFKAFALHPSAASAVKSYLAADAVYGARQLTLVDATSFAVGDNIAVKDNSDSSFSTERNYQQGEFAVITSITGNTVEIDHPLYGNYYLADKNGTTKVDSDGNSLLTVSVIYFASCNICNIALYSDNDNGLGGTVAVELRQMSGELSNVNVFEFAEKIGLKYCKNVNVTNCVTNTKNERTSGYDDYGLKILNSQYVSVFGGQFIASTHGITISGDYTGDFAVVPRFISVFGANCNSQCHDGTWEKGIDSHYGEYLSIIGCSGDGLRMSGNLIMVDDCKFVKEIYVSILTNANSSIINCNADTINVIFHKSALVTYDDDNWTPQETAETFRIENNNLRSTLSVAFDGNISEYPNINNVIFRVNNNVCHSCLSVSMNTSKPGYKANGIDAEITNNRICEVASGGTFALRKLLMKGNIFTRLASASNFSDITLYAGSFKAVNCEFNAHVLNLADVDDVEFVGCTIKKATNNNAYAVLIKKSLVARFTDCVFGSDVKPTHALVDFQATTLTAVDFKRCRADYQLASFRLFTQANDLTVKFISCESGNNFMYDNDSNHIVGTYAFIVYFIGCVAKSYGTMGNTTKMFVQSNINLTGARMTYPSGYAVANFFDLDWLGAFPTSGTTANRPTLPSAAVGFQYFDTDLGHPIWWNGSQWIDPLT